MSATNDSAYEAQKALTDFYHNLPTKHKWKPSGPNPLKKARVEQMEQYLKQYAVPNISKWIRGGRDTLKDYLGDRDVFFYSGGYMGYHLGDKSGGYMTMGFLEGRDTPDHHWNIHPSLLNLWSHSYDTWDITDLVLKKKSHPLLNWINESPFEIK